MPSPLTITRATPADLHDLTPLFAGYRAFYGHAAEPVREEAFLLDRMQRGESIVLLARRDGRAVGFVQLYPIFSSTRMARAWLLNDLFVDPAARGGRIASSLLEAAADVARETGAVELMLQTARDNAPARALYEKHGWVRDDHFLVYTLEPGRRGL